MEQFVIDQNNPAVMALGNADSQMNKLIAIVGDVTVTMRPNYFKSLVRSIIGQQISVAAARAVFGRLETLLEHRIEPAGILNVSDQQLRTIGLSWQKINYLRDLTAKVHNNFIVFEQMADKDNTSVLKQLTSIKGIGKWTAEMFLIFSLGRKNVLAVDDIGIQRGARWLYEVDKSERRRILIDKRPVWEPYLTIASFYLWEVVHLGFDKTYQSIDDMI
ncbi:DNA-3-methyladenine glycosylase family protein [Lentibacillus salicampi]|uniref:DNA-3-methyladenine glycosylase II n=1 Tax=Lentibacillus salicampi TaxID=175306 RepID=A0A4Y9AH74_9BACI|nr:DNA-3-methyladenine glycosylase [Lentibacillus salicampi]TFJ94447.1 DNA-3-methyladenine glycosylase 2 family protein [Lentibacillus salicampi]